MLMIVAFLFRSQFWHVVHFLPTIHLAMGAASTTTPRLSTLTPYVAYDRLTQNHVSVIASALVQTAYSPPPLAVLIPQAMP